MNMPPAVVALLAYAVPIFLIWLVFEIRYRVWLKKFKKGSRK